MGRRETYVDTLRGLADWLPYLLAESGLPGPRGNIELAQAVADAGDEALFTRLLSFDAQRAPANTAEEFLHFCGVMGLGKLLAQGRLDVLPVLRRCAGDARWRTREAVAMALQRWGNADMDALLREMAGWSRGGLLERRAAAAAICEPVLLKHTHHAAAVFDVLDACTSALPAAGDRRSEDFQALRKGLGYCWSVAVAAYPAAGAERMQRWLASADKDVRSVMRENLAKNRMARLDAQWLACARRLVER